MIRFGAVEIDIRRGELRRHGAAVPVEPQVLDLIVFLASNPGRVVSRDEIIANVWGGRIVSDSAISTRMNAARQALGDDGKTQHVIRTVQRRGFLFLLQAEVSADAAGKEASAGSVAAPRDGVLAVRGKPSVAVLPFENLSGDPEQKYFSDGITDDIITELSRYDELFVMARQTTFAYRDRADDAGAIARELGVQYVLLGAVRRAANRVRVSVQLTDTVAGNTVWAERYDRELDDIFAVQDEIASVIVNALAGAVARQHARRVLTKAPGATDAYDHALKAMELLWKVGPRENRLARQEAEKAAEIDPDFARAHALVAWTHVSDGSNHWSDDPAASFDRALAAAHKAVEADDRDPWAHLALGWALIWRDRAHERALVALRRSIALNPSNAHFRSMYGWGLGWAGRPEEALREMELAKRLNPHHPVLYDIFAGRALFHLRRFDDALTHLEPVADAMAGHVNGLALLAASYAAAGRQSEAQETVRSIRRTGPDYTVAYARATMPYAHATDLKLFVEMLEAAGLPE